MSDDALRGQPTSSMLGPHAELGPRRALPESRLLSVGERLEGHYEVTRALGAGGMAEVYHALDHWLAREVAIKITRSELAPHLVREARVLASLSHRGLVTAHAYGRRGPLEYVVLEYLRGDSLSQRLIARGSTSYPVDEALRLVVGLSEALAPLHERGLVHCDLKPANIMCTDDRVVLIDFGLVWDTKAEPVHGPFFGSPPFMAPEAIDGSVKGGEEHLIDIYALGMILFGLLAGTIPFGDPDPNVVMQRQLAGEAAPLSEFRDDLPPRLSSVVASLIRRDPRARPQSVANVRDALVGIPRRGADLR